MDKYYKLFLRKMYNLADHYKRICSLETIHSLKRGFYYKFSESVKQADGFPLLFDIFQNIESDEDRILQLLSDTCINNLFIDNIKVLTRIYRKKDPFLSKKTRIECLFAEQDVLKSTLDQLNRAVRLAPELGMYISTHI